MAAPDPAHPAGPHAAPRSEPHARPRAASHAGPPAGPPDAPLRSSEALVRGFFDAAPMLMGVVEIVEGDIQFLSGNAATAQFYGVSPESLPGRFISEFGETQDSIRDWIHHYRESARIGGRVRFEYELFRPEGPLWLSATVAPAPAPSGSAPRFAYIVEDVTERRPIEEAARRLVEPPERPAAATTVVVDHITDVFFSVDKNWSFTYANHQAERTFLKRREEFIGKSVWEVFPRAVGTLFDTELRRAMERQVTIRFEEYSPSYDAWFEAHVYPSPDGISVFMGNITERKRAEEEQERLLGELESEREHLQRALQALSESRDQYRRMGDTIPYGVWRCDAQGRAVYVSQSFLDLVEMTLDEMRARGWIHRIPPGEVKPMLRRWLRCVKTGETWDSEHHVLGPDGRRHTVLTRGLPVRNEAGEITSWVGINLDITERKQIEQALRESERRYRFMAEASPQIVWTAEPDGLLDFFSGRLEEVTGHQPAEVMGVGWQDIVHSDELTGMAAAWELCLRTGEPFEMEHRVHCSGGKYRWFLTRALAMRNDQGDVEKWFGSSTDIHEHKQAEGALRESQRDLNRAQAVAQTGSWRLNVQKDELLWSDETYRIFGIPGGTSMTYELFLSHTHPEDRDYVNREWTAALRQERPYDIEHRIVVDGEVKWVREVAELEFDDKGELLGGFGTVQDITARTLAEQAVQESEVRFRQLADAMPALVWTANPDGRLDYVNRRVSEFRGIHQENGYWSWEPMVHPEDVEKTVQAWTEAVRTGGVYQVEHRFLRADGTYGWHLCRAVAYRDEDGRIVRWYGTSTDIHDLKEAEAALSRADQAKDRFVATLAHELRDPLNTAAMVLQAVKVVQEGDERQGNLYTEVIGRQVATMTRLVNDLLDLARIKQGKVHLQRKRVTLGSIVADAIETVRPLIEERRHGLEVEVPAEPLWLEGDPVRLGQVVGNLLNNAAKYTEPGGTITVTAEREAGRAVLRVRDTGIGITRDMIPQVFDLFAQADASDQRARGGMGLGLSLVRQLVEMHGGTAEAASEGPGQGSTFTVRIPLVDPADS